MIPDFLVTNINDPTISKALSRLYHTAILYKTWNQSDANTLCSNNYCGPYCNYTDPSCISYSMRNDLSLYQNPTGTLDSLSSCINQCTTQVGQPDCPSELCFRTFNKNGDIIYPNGEESILIFGGKTYSTTSIVDNCEADIMIRKYDSTICPGTLLNDLLVYDLSNQRFYSIQPSNQGPSGRFGHTAVYIEIMSQNDNTIRKYMLIYGGFDANGIQNDFWSYEIPWAPMRYYPVVGSQPWKVGNDWEAIVYSSNNNNPGRRAFHSMVSDGKDNIFIFGGLTWSASSSLNTSNDLWKYTISTKEWTLIEVFAIKKATRSITLWDGTTDTIDVEFSDIQDTDNVVYKSIQNIGCTSDDVLIPTCRAYHSISYNNDIIYIFGGVAIKSDGSLTYLNDLWMINVSSANPTWYKIHQHYFGDPILDTTMIPSARAFSSYTLHTFDKPYYFIFGGSNVFVGFLELWVFNIKDRVWNQINSKPFGTNSPIPMSSKGATLTAYTDGIILIGGYSFNISMGTYSIALNSGIWIYRQNSCQISPNSNNGYCYWGQSRCKANYYGDDCSSILCPGSFCIQDTNIISSSQCFFCNSNGVCTNNQCVCNQGYTLDDCSSLACENNCSNTATQTVADCSFTYPINVCSCQTITKRGGDNCGNIFCLNDCGGHGKCNTLGECECEESYAGTDCSILMIDLYGYEFKLAYVYVMYGLLSILMFIV